MNSSQLVWHAPRQNELVLMLHVSRSDLHDQAWSDTSIQLTTRKLVRCQTRQEQTNKLTDRQ